jgi:hypothetical protein
MGTIVQVTTTVREDGSIEVHAPGLTPGQQVTVSIESATESNEERRTGPHVIDIITQLAGHRQFKTAEEVDEYIRQERASWDR